MAAAHTFGLLYVGALRAASVDASSNETQAAALDNHSALSMASFESVSGSGR